MSLLLSFFYRVGRRRPVLRDTAKVIHDRYMADQVRTDRYPLRFMLSGFAFVSLAFFYDSFMRLLPILGYLTAFDKYIYCLYLWLIASIISLALMCRVFR